MEWSQEYMQESEILVLFVNEKVKTYGRKYELTPS